MTHGFASATSVTPAGPDRWSGHIDDGWDIGGNTNGGYLLGIAGRALRAATERPDPVTVTAHYLAPGRPGPTEVTTEVIKAGKRFTTARATMDSGGRTLLSVLASYGVLDDPPGVAGAASEHDGYERLDTGPPDLPDPDTCIGAADDAGFAPAFMHRVDLRLHPDDAGFRNGTPSGRALMRGWLRLHDGEPIDGMGLLLATDAFPPTVFNAELPVAWVPTISLSVHVRQRPAPGWLRGRFATRFVTGGFLEEDGELWDSAGRLVAQSRQLALLPRPPAA